MDRARDPETQVVCDADAAVREENSLSRACFIANAVKAEVRIEPR